MQYPGGQDKGKTPARLCGRLSADPFRDTASGFLFRHRGEIPGAEGLDLPPVVYVQGAAVQPLQIQVHGVLEGHGRERQARVPQPVEEGIEIHLI